MSVATAETGLSHEATVPEEMPDGIAPRGIALSVALHLILGTVFIVGLPAVRSRSRGSAVPVQLDDRLKPATVQIRTRVDAAGPPVADAPVTKPEPEPPVPTLIPPPSAETPPPELVKPPEPKPAPPLPVLKPEASPNPEADRKGRVPSKESRNRRSKWPRTIESRAEEIRPRSIRSLLKPRGTAPPSSDAAAAASCLGQAVLATPSAARQPT
jgi:outer membrane biosynthesis protein TonB